MAVGTYNLPICDGCQKPWLPVNWTQDSDPRNPDKPLRCGKCKSIGWDREFVKAEKIGNVGEVATPSVSKTESSGSSPDAPAILIVPIFPQAKPGDEGYGLTNLVSEHIPPTPRARCRHRMTDCPICHPKEAA